MRSPLILLACAATLLLAPAAADAAPAPAPCANATLVPAAGNLDAVRDALVCLHNQARAKHGLQPVRTNRRLQRGAQARVADMLRAGYLDHTSPRGVPFDRAITRSGYARGARDWDVGENLGGGSGTLGTATELMRTWLASPSHRRNLLRPSYRDIGIGLGLTARGELKVAVELGLKR